MHEWIFGLWQFGISPSAFRRLGSRKVHVSIHLRTPKVERLQKYPPDERLRRMNAMFERGVRAIETNWEGGRLSLRLKVTCAWKIDGRTTVKNALKIAGLSQVEDVWINRIERVKKRPTPKTMHYYAVRGRVAVQIEGQTSGYQKTEDRIVLVKAFSEEDACRRLQKEWKDYAAPHLNEDGRLFRFLLEEIVDVYNPSIYDEKNLSGTEVYSDMGRRRLRPKDVWLPLGGRSKNRRRRP